jgi:hypothetical protein
MLTTYAANIWRALADDYHAHLTPELKRLSQAHAQSELADIAPALQALERTHGRALLRLDTRGAWAFTRSIVATTRPQFWRTLIYMVLSTIA